MLHVFYRIPWPVSLGLLSDGAAILRPDTTEPRPTTICLACGDQLSPALERSASLRCHDCRDRAAPLRPDLVGRMKSMLARLSLRSAA